MKFFEIYNMVNNASYCTTSVNTILECATRIYIKQMEIEAEKARKE